MSNPEIVNDYIKSGDYKRMQGKYTEAKAEYQKALEYYNTIIKDNPTGADAVADARYNRGLALVRLGWYEAGAREVYIAKEIRKK